VNLFFSPISEADNVTVDFSYTGAAQTWNVPSGVTSITFTVKGASGGKSNGGFGASISGTMTVTPSSTLQINVGQIGQTSASGTTATAFNGGGSASRYGSGGGGASDIRTGAYALSNRIVVAGGGGGGDGSSTPPSGSSSGGNAGYPNGANGIIASGGSLVGNPGNGATQSSGGSGGAGASSCGAEAGTNGTLGVGGNGATASAGGSGGGGGYYGGGGAGSGCNPSAGGGGSSYINATFVSGVTTSLQATRTSGSVQIIYSGPDATAPTFTSSASFSVAENIATSVTAATIKVSESSTVTISSGVDAARFNITRSETDTAIIKFNVSPNFEAPIDVGGNNVYDLTLTATDAAANAGTQSITITVTDVVDTSGFNSLALAGSATAATYRTVVVITANITVASKVTFRVNGKILPGCKNKSTTGSSPNIVATCTWKPSNRGNVSLTAGAVPTGAGISSTTSSPVSIMVGKRVGPR
jgi:hypothetical protein